MGRTSTPDAFSVTRPVELELWPSEMLAWKLVGPLTNPAKVRRPSIATSAPGATPWMANSSTARTVADPPPSALAQTCPLTRSYDACPPMKLLQLRAESVAQSGGNPGPPLKQLAGQFGLACAGPTAMEMKASAVLSGTRNCCACGICIHPPVSGARRYA